MDIICKVWEAKQNRLVGIPLDVLLPKPPKKRGSLGEPTGCQSANCTRKRGPAQRALTLPVLGGNVPLPCPPCPGTLSGNEEGHVPFAASSTAHSPTRAPRQRSAERGLSPKLPAFVPETHHRQLACLRVASEASRLPRLAKACLTVSGVLPPRCWQLTRLPSLFSQTVLLLFSGDPLDF